MQDVESLGAPLPAIPGRKSWTKDVQLCLNFNRSFVAQRIASELLTHYVPLFANVRVVLDLESLQSSGLISRNKNDTLLTNNAQNATNNDTISLYFGAHWPEEVSVHWCNSSRGWLQNRCLKTCIEFAEDKRDVLYMADDDYVDFVRAAKLPRDKIWAPRPSHHNGTDVEDVSVFKGHRWTPKGE